MQNKRKAFTMIELVFVIVIMGILAKFGVAFLFQAYNNFISSKINNELQAESESAIEFSASRLQYRIKDSVVIRRDINDSNVTAIADANDSNYTVIEWVGTDSDGFRGEKLPNWSGIIDIDLSDKDNLYSPETNTTKENNLIQALSNNKSDINDSAIYFLGSDSDIHSGYGWEGAITDQNRTMHPINSDTNISIFVPASTTNDDFHDVGEQYKLAWSAYALSLEDYNTTTKMGNLYFYYNFQPWNGAKLTDANISKSLLMKNVSTFQFAAVGSLLKLQICVKSMLKENYSLCKEKTIF